MCHGATPSVCPSLPRHAGSLQVTEPPEPNSGLVQGTLVRRHKIPRQGGGLLGLGDLTVGAVMNIYGREVTIVDADAFTREQAAARGMPLAPAQPVPPNPIEQALAAKSKPSGECPGAGLCARSWGCEDAPVRVLAC